ncbi:THUMP domain-containing class I SAM-dependent RNA methyltransferase [Jeotgalibaca caeni]|uniref:THUMP domain-containing class I SAM-dependent RNA methyltransferase n=1 Tax=Jeotgalibaca caeni TaxID=3028623 RepID=UPI00237D469F|nr:class I SAM-dependent RNA methyltransferase [Jeotgalibaca caeni]MDE1547877.1 class I SAM-dependent RNA methyltransferase [Jeotgalibaca caeni]
MTNYQLVATVASGIEAVTGNELKEMGYQVEVENGKVFFQGSTADIIKTNLWLRTGDRIKIVYGSFPAKTFDDLYEKTKALPWEDLLPMDAAFPVSGKSHKSTLYSVPDCQSIVKKAIVDRLSSFYHRRARLPETGATYPIEVAILKDQVSITVDTSGYSLFKRGYRTEKGGAPIKENMAAAMVLLTNWSPDKPFYDPTCGSGTIPIEAALIGLNIAPGLERDFAAEDWSIFEADEWDKHRNEAKLAADFSVELDIMGSDIDTRMIEIAKRNAAKAGVEDFISFKQLQLSDFQTDKEYGVIVSNPPYGERLENEEYVENLYRQMGDTYRSLDTWSKYILTSDLDFENFYGQKATKKRKLYNGRLRTDYFQFWGKRPPRKPREE